MRIPVAVVATVVLAVGGVGTAAVVTSSADVADRAHHGHAVDPGRFRHPEPNAYFPLTPGTVFRYRGTDEGAHYRERLSVTHRTKPIEGVRTRVLRDVLRRADGSLAEKTSDWYAADDDGNVWYFGERTATYDRHGHVASREGSWQAGVGGAVPGMIMPARPRPTDAYRQELDRGNAEDQAWVVQRGFSAHIAYGRVHHVVRSLEWSRLEKGVVSEKLYAPHLGTIWERDLSGGSERFELVSVHRP
ncbi:hypothetical protein [Nocardioides panaciterrulae]|uniref:Uncharacterized protein n=1 Tax=Nocardioides panaciterrulae TaxID=661492 RepID=A0A7Y9JAV6_9ACTN|nr:hypothetical protein [Nocardioides panaciterrulae]NYD42280.1 hypothetical protein [Nocardioides panaciterrulae]